MACFVPGCSTGGAGVLRSAWMLYHFDGMSFSSRRNFVRFLSVVLTAMPTSLERRGGGTREKVGPRYERAAALSTKRGCYTARRGGFDDPHAAAAARRWIAGALHADRERGRGGAGRTHPEPRCVRRGPRRGRSARRHQSDARGRARLGRDARLPPLSLVARPRGRRGHGHLAARHGVRLADSP